MKSLTVGDPLDDKTDFGAIINETQLNSIDEKVQDGYLHAQKFVQGMYILVLHF
jgi:lactaldehyde dehydrogenase/glycolaldehyde dehydrogenase